MKMATSLVLYTCLATMVSQAAVIGYFWSSGALTRHKARQIMDVLAGVDMIPADSVSTSHASEDASQQVSYEEVLQQRVAKSLNLDLREQAVAKGLADLQALAAQLQEDTRRFDVRKQAFHDNLNVLAQQTKGTAITDVRLTLEAMRPRQAKDQMMRMLKDDQMEAVVTIIKGMSLDKRKKLLAEFKAGDEPDRLADILKQILQGVPETAAIEQAQNEMAAPPN
jgi:hypothetical protein